MGITRTPMVDDDGSGLTGTIINNAWKQEFYNQIDAVTAGAWQLYTPAWVGSASNPTIGNGILQGQYAILGNMCLLQIQLTYGSTTQIGNGYYTLSLPTQMIFAGALGMAPLQGVLWNAARNKYSMLTTAQASASAVYAFVSETPGLWSHNTAAWAANDYVSLAGFYRIG